MLKRQQVCQPSARLCNALAYNGDSVVAILGDDEMLLYDGNQAAPLARFSVLDHPKCMAMSGDYLLLFEEGRFCVFEREGDDWTKWKRKVSWDVLFFAFDCALRVTKECITVLAASVCGLHVWTIDRRAKKTEYQAVFPGHSICIVELDSVAGTVALATLDGHFGIWQLSALTQLTLATSGSSFLWFSESGGRITSVAFNNLRNQCAVVCWDGSGAVFGQSSIDSWQLVRDFAPSAVFGAAESSLAPPALCLWTEDGNLLHVLLNGTLKSYGDETVGFNVNRIICKDSKVFGLCRMGKEARAAIVDDAGSLIEIEIKLIS